ncbi:MAG TPA: ABC transporter ATP-binding protein [Actinomycetota bacterium]|nr:ABC transporter ATP-binding protein [Actinomycetota bacterium]
MIRTEGLTKRYGRLVAVDGLDLEVHQGDLFGFLGPNGSGKTTTVRMLLGLVFATSGRIQVLGRPMPRAAGAVLAEVGSLVEGPAFYPHLSGTANLALFDAAGPAGPGGGRASRRRRIRDALGQVGLDGVGRRPLKAYSSGMRQRLGLAAALLRAPRLLVLDEPTNGLDPQGMREIRDLLAELAAGGVTVFLSSHLLAEVELVCTRAAIIDRGRLVAQDRVAALLAPTGRVLVTTPDVGRAAELAAGLAGVRPGERYPERLVVHLDGTVPEALNRHLVAGGVRVRELVVERPSLEDVFLDLTAAGGSAPRNPPDRFPAEWGRGAAG